MSDTPATGRPFARRLAWTLAIPMLAMLVAASVACGGGGNAKSAASSPGASESATVASSTAAGTPAPKSALETFDSFHYTVRVKLEVSDDLGAVTVDVAGDYAKFDKHSFTQKMDFGGTGGETSVIIIGSDAWTKNTDAGWSATTPADPDIASARSISSADPEFFAQLGFGEALKDLPFEAARVDGRSARRYELTKDLLNDISGAIGGGVVSDAALAAIVDFKGAAWVDDDTALVTRFELRFVGPSAEAESGAISATDPGGMATITFSLELTRINNKSIKIEPPI